MSKPCAHARSPPAADLRLQLGGSLWKSGVALYIYIHTRVCVCVCVRACLSLYIYMYTYIYIYMYVCMCIYIYIWLLSNSPKISRRLALAWELGLALVLRDLRARIRKDPRCTFRHLPGRKIPLNPWTITESTCMPHRRNPEEAEGKTVCVWFYLDALQWNVGQGEHSCCRHLHKHAHPVLRMCPHAHPEVSIRSC